MSTDFSFYLQQGSKLVEKDDPGSKIKGVEHFVKANQLTVDGDIAKPQTLYHVAYGYFILGDLEMAYKVAWKAKRAIPLARQNSFISMSVWPGENNINEIIAFIEERHPDISERIDVDDIDFDENNIDFEYLYSIYGAPAENKITPEFNRSNLTKELLSATFGGMSANDEHEIYFDKLKGDVLQLVEGYLTSTLGDQSAGNRRLVERITNGEPPDYIDENRYIQLHSVDLKTFLEEYRLQSMGKEPFYSFTFQFAEEMIEKISEYEELEEAGISFNFFMTKEFGNSFTEKYPDRVATLGADYSRIFENTCNSLARKWIEKEIFNSEQDKSSYKINNMNFEFTSSDHLRYEKGVHTAGPHGGARRLVKVEPNISGGEGHSVTIYNLDGNHPVWRNNVQMGTKQMKVIKEEKDKIVLRGFGYDALGGSFSDYGITIHFQNGQPVKCILHMHDRSIDIEYLS